MFGSQTSFKPPEIKYHENTKHALSYLSLISVNNFFVSIQGQTHAIFVSNQGHVPANLITARDLQNNSPSA